MKATLTVDQSQFQAALSEYVKWCKRGLAEIINKKATIIAWNAYHATPRADRGEVMRANSVSVWKITTSKKTGKQRTRYQLDDQRQVVDMIQGRRVNAGQPPLTQAQAKKMALGYVVKRINAIGTLAAGWVDSIRILMRAAREPLADIVWKKHKGIGTAKPAANGWNPTAEFSYNLTERKPSGFQIDPRCQIALQAAFDKEAASMMDYVARKMQEKADTVNAK